MDKAEDLLLEWQSRLRLNDWVIVLCDKCKPAEMTEQNTAGCTEWNECGKQARIEILDPEYYGACIVPFDWEKTLVHELLHLKLSLVSAEVSDIQERVTHQIIDDLAKAFVDAKRASTGILTESAESALM